MRPRECDLLTNRRQNASLFYPDRFFVAAKQMARRSTMRGALPGSPLGAHRLLMPVFTIFAHLIAAEAPNAAK
jgi:hypothetical protein